ncbi:MAG TPA: hypothetical protein VNZ25_06945, partial [Candidatus Angelobacter sp.]|nr:hypothetical protein [Candidatus Angelobacter sp.]
AVRAPIFWLILITTVVVLSFLHGPQRQRQRPDTVAYRGRQFKLARVYATYEDYKDDPNNLDTNELGRIEQAITTAKVPTVFKNRGEFIHVLFDLKFPGYGYGYGLGGLGENPKTDDGSILEAETIEIPQRDKSRYLVVRESSGHYDLIDDFIASTATNAIVRVKLEARTLRYYDERGDLVREQQF